jgi:hypothetical protein
MERKGNKPFSREKRRNKTITTKNVYKKVSIRNALQSYYLKSLEFEKKQFFKVNLKSFYRSESYKSRFFYLFPFIYFFKRT